MTITEQFNKKTNNEHSVIGRIITLTMVIRHRRRRLLKVGLDGV